MKKIRIDDIGASSKQYNQYSRWKLANIGPLKRWGLFRNWGPYEELTPNEWNELLEIFRRFTIRPMIAITACWVETDGTLIPFPQKFPLVASLLRSALAQGTITIANHGLTHCVVGKHLPRFFGANRVFHREFWPWLPDSIHHDHIVKSQEILESNFGVPITVFVPPGNVWSIKTYKALQESNITTVVSRRFMLDSKERMKDIEFIDDRESFIVLHDRDIKEKGIPWFTQMLSTIRS